jgi:hypothetical protein
VELFWFVVAPIAIIIAAITLVDVFRAHHGGWTTAAWVLLIVVLPFVGSIIYWFVRKPPQSEVDAAYLAERDITRSR